jgi:uncharacterized protein
MGKVLIRFYEELNDFLPPGKRKRDFEVPLNGNETVREIIEKLGVPPEQVDLLLVNGQSAALDHLVGEGDRVSVYPVFERFNIQGVSRVRERPLRELSFILDSDLKALAQALERLGQDVCFREALHREETLQAAKQEHRIFLTVQGDIRGLQGLDRVIVLKPGSLREQVHQVIDALDIGVEPERESYYERKKRGEASHE